MENEKRKYAGFIVRFAAFAVDFLVLILISIIAGIVFSVIRGIAGTNWDVEVISGFIGFLLNAGYYVFMTYKYGATIGKKIFGLKVESVSDERLDIGTVVVREVAGKFISITLAGIGYIWIIFDKKKQGLHDKLAGTVVMMSEQDRIAKWKAGVIAGTFAISLVCFSVWITFGILDEEFQERINIEQTTLSISKMLVSGKLCVSEGNDIKKPISNRNGGGDICSEKIGSDWPKLLMGYEYGKINNESIFVQKNGVDIIECEIEESSCDLVE